MNLNSSTHIQNNAISIIASHIVVCLYLRKNKKLGTIYSSYNASDSLLIVPIVTVPIQLEQD